MNLDFEQLVGEAVVGEAHLVDTGVNLVNLDSIQITEAERGNGYGSLLLQQVTAAADAEGITVTLTADPTPGSPFSAKQLCKWFGRNHFVSDPEDLYAMTREPNPALT